MRKSIIFLLGSLIMLLPFVSNIIFLKALGIQDDLFKVYVKYESDMANNYEDEYKSLSHANDNNHISKNSNFIKKIKCNNINLKLNGLETTTDINLPVGLEAVSVPGNGERNSDRFNIDCNINNNNNAGEERETDSQGSAGSNQINLTNIYINPGNINDTAINGKATSIAMCNEGDKVLSGSYFISFPYTEDFPVNSDTIVDSALPTQDGWKTEAFESDTDIVKIQTFVQCFDNL